MASTARKPSIIRRREIAEAALKVIGQQGAPSLTAAALAEEVGLTAGALFRHFASIDEILEAAVDLAIEAIDGTFPADDLPPTEKLRAMALARVALVGSTPGIAWLLQSDQVYLFIPSAAVARLRGLVRRSRSFLLSAFDEGICGGTIRSDLPAATMLPIYTGTVHSLMAGRSLQRSKKQPPGTPTPDQVIDALLALLTAS